MAYEKTVWVNGQAPALDAEHLNKIEQGIADVDVMVQANSVGSVSKSLNASELQGYLDSLPRLLTEEYYITLSGTCSQIVYLKGFYGCGSITLRAANLGDCVFTKNMEIISCHVPVNMEKLKWELNAESPSDRACIVCAGSTVNVEGCSFTGYVPSSGTKIGRGATTMKQGSVVLWNCAFHDLEIVLNTYMSGFISINGGPETDYSGNVTGVYAYQGGLIMLGDVVPPQVGGTGNVLNGGGAIIKGNVFVS